MRNIVGKPVSGEDFFLRINIVNLIYRRLNSGSHLFMAAPRRVGKTSIMYHLRDFPRDNYAFIYINTEPIENTELYFKSLFEALLNSEAIKETVRRSHKARKLFEKVTERVKKIGLFGVELELNAKKEGKYSEEFHDLMRKVDTEGFTIVLMVDEFPSTIENIRQKSGDGEAVHFLKLNRAMRQEAGHGIQFIYTGSIGLPVIVTRLRVPESINDLNEVEIPPLDEAEGTTLVKALLEQAGIKVEEKVIFYLLRKVRWLMPFFIQIAVQELIDLVESGRKTLDEKAVDDALGKTANRRNDIHFKSYFSRLKEAFTNEDYSIALQILNAIAAVDMLPKDALFLNVKTDEDKRRIHAILDSLEYDGYINRMNGDYRFNSPILQRWWTRYVPKS